MGWSYCWFWVVIVIYVSVLVVGDFGGFVVNWIIVGICDELLFEVMGGVCVMIDLVVFVDM